MCHAKGILRACTRQAENLAKLNSRGTALVGVENEKVYVNDSFNKCFYAVRL